MKLADFPRVRLGHFPTPLEPMDNLRRALGVETRIFVKRDDCTGLALGGNKTRKLEFLMGDALARESEVVVTKGVPRSNHLRQTAAAAARCDMDCRVLLESSPDAGAEGENAPPQDEIFGARCEFFPAGTDLDAEVEALCEKLRVDGCAPYLIPGGGSNAIGALGYAACALETMEQARQMDFRPTRIVHATDSAGTQAGLLAGMALANYRVCVTGVSVASPKDEQTARIAALAEETAKLLGASPRLSPDAVKVDDRLAGTGYNGPDEETGSAIELLAREEGIMLDPVCSGKGFAGFLSLLREGAFGGDEDVVFLHTGGALAMLAYQRELAAARREDEESCARAA